MSLGVCYLYFWGKKCFVRKKEFFFFFSIYSFSSQMPAVVRTGLGGRDLTGPFPASSLGGAALARSCNEEQSKGLNPPLSNEGCKV